MVFFVTIPIHVAICLSTPCLQRLLSSVAPARPVFLLRASASMFSFSPSSQTTDEVLAAEASLSGRLCRLAQSWVQFVRDLFAQYLVLSQRGPTMAFVAGSCDGCLPRARLLIGTGRQSLYALRYDLHPVSLRPRPSRWGTVSHCLPSSWGWRRVPSTSLCASTHLAAAVSRGAAKRPTCVGARR